MDSADTGRVKVLMFPWLAYGHITPFLELAKKLSHRNFDLYICSTPANMNSIKNKITESYSLHIHLLELHLPTDELPPEYHTTNCLPLHLNSALRRALKATKPTFSNLVKALQPHLLIADLMLPWARSVAYQHNIPGIIFSIYSAATLAYYLHLALHEGSEFPFPALRPTSGYELSTMVLKKHESAEYDPMYLPHEDQVLVLVRGSRTTDGKYMDYACEVMKKWKLIHAGALVEDTYIGEDDRDGNELIEWLGRKDAFSSVLVAFGSESFLKKEELEEAAYGLEMSNVNFIWVLRTPKGEEISVEELLPRGFLERVRGRGVIVDRWAPQEKILSHSSIGGFLSHCGWTSVLESIKYLVPIIAMPIHVDQPVNAKLAVELGVGVGVVRDGNGKLQSEEISRAIRDVVDGKRGEIIRRRAEELRASIRSRSEEDMDGVVHELTHLCGKIHSPYD